MLNIQPYNHSHISTCILWFMQPIEFVGRSLDDLRSFPVEARRKSGYQLDRVQRGLEPSDWKPMPSIGSGVREIRIRDANGAFRVIYVAKLGTNVYVLHCFQKKRQQTARTDLDVAANRYRQVVAQLGQEKGQQL